MSHGYVHGYDAHERGRLDERARTLADLLHADTFFPKGSTVLEPGCGVGAGAQTLPLTRQNPGTDFTSVDICEDSIAEASAKIRYAGPTNVQFQRADIADLPFAHESCDHVLICFVLDHLRRPVGALERLIARIKPGGTLTDIEGDHGSALSDPESEEARAVIACQVMLQRERGGNALIGRALYPLMSEAGIGAVQVAPRVVYADASRPEMIEEFTKKTFIPMIEGVHEPALANQLIDARRLDAAVRALRRTTEGDGVFCYTFFKAVGRKEDPA